MTAAWYAVWTKPRQETRAVANLDHQGFEVWLPRIGQMRRRRGHRQYAVEPMFPRYLFLRADAQEQSLASVRSSRGCCDLVRVGSSPAVVPQQVLEALRRCCDADGVIPDRREWQRGQDLEVKEGPFAGLRAIFEAPTSRDRVNVLIYWLGAWQRATVRQDDLVTAN